MNGLKAAMEDVGRRLLMCGALVLWAFVPASAEEQSGTTGSFDAKQTHDIQQIVRQYILDHPEVIVETMQRLEPQQQQAEEQRRTEAAGAVKPVGHKDHLLGNAAAPVKVIEFSDFECPFCKQFHATMRQLMDEYGKDGKIAWVYRHFPLDELHSKARKEGQAAECANELGGNKSFWAYTDRLFEIAPSNNRLDLALLPQIAQEIGLNGAAFESCLAGDARGGKYADHIESDYRDATAAGGNGTPYTIVIGPNGKLFPISGAQPYRALKAIVDAALKEK